MMKALTFWIFSSSGTPMTQLICTSSWASKMFSSWEGYTLYPLVTIMRLMRCLK